MAPITLVEGNEAYRQMMFRLSTDPEYRLGADEIENIASMLSKLHVAALNRLDTYIHWATLAYPDLPALVAENIRNNVFREAFPRGNNYTEVLNSSHDGDNDIHAAHAILAGHGLGLCQPWQSEEDCSCEEHQDLPANTYLLVAYYSYGLEMVLTEATRSSYTVQSYTYNNYSLGYKLQPFRRDDWSSYWDDVRVFMRTTLRKHPGSRPRTLILYGDRSTDGMFQVALEEVLLQVLGCDDLPHRLLDGVDPVYGGAIGAADMLKRNRYRRSCWD
jgi:hypothetical protein